MKSVFALLLSFLCTAALSQSVGFYYGANASHFYHNKNKNAEVLSIYQPMQGTCQGVFVDQAKTKTKIPSFSIQYEEYQGHIILRSGGNSTEVLYHKNSLGFGIYPLNKNFLKNFTFHSGLEISLLLRERFEGKRRLDYSPFEDFSDKASELNKPVTFFIKNQLSYDLAMSEKLSFRVQFAFLYGLNKEFHLKPDITKSLRYFLGIGLNYNLGG